MTSIPPLSIGLDFLMCERVNEREASPSGAQEGKKADTEIQTSFKMELEKHLKNCIQWLLSPVKYWNKWFGDILFSAGDNLQVDREMKGKNKWIHCLKESTNAIFQIKYGGNFHTKVLKNPALDTKILSKLWPLFNHHLRAKSVRKESVVFDFSLRNRSSCQNLRGSNSRWTICENIWNLKWHFYLSVTFISVGCSTAT